MSAVYSQESTLQNCGTPAALINKLCILYTGNEIMNVVTVSGQQWRSVVWIRYSLVRKSAVNQP